MPREHALLVAPLDQEQSLQTVLRENHQIALFSIFFAQTGPSLSSATPDL